MEINMEDKKRFKNDAKALKQDGYKKPTVEELNNYCNQLFMQNKELASRLNEVLNIQNKLPWLFKVLEYSQYFSEDFVTSCAKEAEYILKPEPEVESEQSDKGE